MGSLLGLAIMNSIMTELESSTIKEVFDQSFVKLQIRHAVDSLLSVKEKNINVIQKSQILYIKTSNLLLVLPR